MPAKIVNTIVYISSFVMCYYCFLALDFEKILRRNKTLQAQVLAVLLAMGLGWLVAQFMFSLSIYLPS